MIARKYFHMQERNFEKINSCWKFLHALIFFVLIVSSFMAADDFTDLFDTFNYKCVFFGVPFFKLDFVKFYNITTNHTAVPGTNTSDLSINTNESAAEPSNTLAPITPQFFEMDQPPVLLSRRKKRLRQPERPTDWSKANKIPNTVNIYMHEDVVWFYNGTISGAIGLRMMKTAFSPDLECNFVLFTTLVTLILASFFFVIILICGRGGRMPLTHPYPQSWTYIYVVLVVSLFMLVVELVAFRYLYWGVQAFCKNFQGYTGQQKCTPAMNYFTKQQRMGYRNFYLAFLKTVILFIIMIIMWLAQLVLTILRVICMVDFQLHTTLVVKKKKRDYADEEEEFQKLHQAVKAKTPGCVDGGFAEPKEMEDFDIKDDDETAV